MFSDPAFCPEVNKLSDLHQVVKSEQINDERKKKKNPQSLALGWRCVRKIIPLCVLGFGRKRAIEYFNLNSIASVYSPSWLPRFEHQGVSGGIRNWIIHSLCLSKSFSSVFICFNAFSPSWFLTLTIVATYRHGYWLARSITDGMKSRRSSWWNLYRSLPHHFLLK